VTTKAFTNARPTDDNAFKIPLAMRALAATITEGKSA
jgi:xanthine dehydrogenase YagS FAD-binding subunit